MIMIPVSRSKKEIIDAFILYDHSCGMFIFFSFLYSLCKKNMTYYELFENSMLII